MVWPYLFLGETTADEDSDQDYKPGWVWEGDKETGDWVWSESGQECVWVRFVVTFCNELNMVSRHAFDHGFEFARGGQRGGRREGGMGGWRDGRIGG